jgi:hypothetical protein
LFALLAARQANDSPADAGRIALMSMVVKPPILGLLFAVVMAKQAAAAPATAVLSTSSTASNANTSQGAVVFNQVAPDTDFHSFFPSFIQFTRNQAAEFAKELRLKVKFIEPGGKIAKDLVTDQDPEPGANWPADRVVTLTLS